MRGRTRAKARAFKSFLEREHYSDTDLHRDPRIFFVFQVAAPVWQLLY